MTRTDIPVSDVVTAADAILPAGEEPGGARGELPADWAATL
jgi:hypothetical protein